MINCSIGFNFASYTTGNEFYFFDHRSQDINEFYLLGTVLGLAIYNGIILDLHFPQVVYKKLCDRPLELSDLSELDSVG